MENWYGGPVRTVDPRIGPVPIRITSWNAPVAVTATPRLCPGLTIVPFAGEVISKLCASLTPPDSVIIPNTVAARRYARTALTFSPTGCPFPDGYFLGCRGSTISSIETDSPWYSTLMCATPAAMAFACPSPSTTATRVLSDEYFTRFERPIENDHAPNSAMTSTDRVSPTLCNTIKSGSGRRLIGASACST